MMARWMDGRSLLLAVFLGCLSGVLGAQGSRGVVRSPLERDGAGMLIVSVDLVGHGEASHRRAFRFILDTGASRSVVDASIPSCFFPASQAPMLGRLKDSTEHSIPMERVTLSRLEIGGHVRENLPVFRTDLKRSFLARFQDDPVDGILGMDILEGTRFIIDPKAQEVRWGGALEGTRMPLGRDPHGRPTLTIRLDGTAVCCYLDTGARSAFRLQGEPKPGPSGVPFHYQGLAGKPRMGFRVVVERIELGSQAWINAPLERVRPGEAGDHLGRAALCAAPLELDLVHGEAVFTPGPDGSLPILREPEEPVLVWKPGAGGRSLRVGSCPQRWVSNGMRVGDEVLQVGPLKGRALSIGSVQALLARGGAHAWILGRKGRIVQVRGPFGPS